MDDDILDFVSTAFQPRSSSSNEQGGSQPGSSSDALVVSDLYVGADGGRDSDEDLDQLALVARGVAPKEKRHYQQRDWQLLQHARSVKKQKRLESSLAKSTILQLN